MERDDDRVLLPGALDSYTGGDASAAADIYTLALESSQQDAAVLREALAEGDVQAACAAAHRVKGASEMVGAALQAEAAQHVETACRAGDLSQARTVLVEFEREHARLRAHLVALLGNSAPG